MIEPAPAVRRRQARSFAEDHPLAAEIGRRVAKRAKAAVRRKAGDALHRIGDWCQEMVDGVHHKAEEVAAGRPLPSHPPVAPPVVAAPPVVVRPVVNHDPPATPPSEAEREVLADASDGGSPLRSI